MICCSHCHLLTSEDKEFCEHCGRPIRGKTLIPPEPPGNPPDENKFKTAVIVLACILIIQLIILVVLNIKNNSVASRDCEESVVCEYSFKSDTFPKERQSYVMISGLN